MEEIKNKLREYLKLIGIENINQSTYFFNAKPDSFYSDGETIYFEDGVYHIVGQDRGQTVVKKEFSDSFQLLYYLLNYYILRQAGKSAIQKISGNFDLYEDMFHKEQIRLFSLIDPVYAEFKRKEFLG